MPDKYLIVGLGNPGRKYAKNRHNLGFLAMDAIAERFGGRFISKQCEAMVAQTSIANKQVILAKPQLYMNRSGEVVSCLAAYHQIDSENIIIISDDADLPFATLRLRKKGSAGGHNGLKSIIDHLHTQSFPRLRIGIGRPADKEMVDYVLSDLSQAEMVQLQPLFLRIYDIIVAILEKGIDHAMNICNARETLPK